MPISLTLESIRMELDAIRVWLPTREDMRTIRASRQGFPITQSSETSSASQYIDHRISPPFLNIQASLQAAQSMAPRDQRTEISSFAPHPRSPTFWNRVSERIHRTSKHSTPSNQQAQSLTFWNRVLERIHLTSKPQMDYGQPNGPSNDYSYRLVAPFLRASSQPAAMQPIHLSSSVVTSAQLQQQEQGPHSQPKPDIDDLERRQWSDSGYASLEGSPLPVCDNVGVSIRREVHEFYVGYTESLPTAYAKSADGV